MIELKCRETIDLYEITELVTDWDMLASLFRFLNTDTKYSYAIK